MKIRRNALSPISSLPPEVFIAIFSHLCLPGTSSSLHGRILDSDYHLTRLCVSHVCHQWREIALDQPLLWSHIDFFTQSAAGTAEILTRAKSAPLYLEASVSDCDWDDVRFRTLLQELPARIPYIYRLRISADPTDLDNIIRATIMSRSAFSLEHLSLSSQNERAGRRTRRRYPIPDSLFNDSTPRLSCLELCYCDISWESPLFKGLKHLEILRPSARLRPDLTIWLDALNEMPQLKTLILHSASPVAPSLPFNVERTITLPSLTRLDISGSPGDCALALAHLYLPALTSLCLSAITSPSHQHNGDVRILVLYIARHAHGPQDTKPLQSALIRSESNHTEILAYPVPDIDVEVYKQPTSLATARVALSFSGGGWHTFDERIELLWMVLAGLPLGGLVVLAAHELMGSPHDRGLSTRSFWLNNSAKMPRLQRVLLSPHTARGFLKMLTVEIVQEDGGHLRRWPVLPSLTELVMVDFSLYSLSLLPLYDALAKRMEREVPLERLDLRMCSAHSDGRSDDWLQSLSKFVVDVLVQEESSKARQMKTMWKIVACGPFVDGDDLSDNEGWFIDDDNE